MTNIQLPVSVTDLFSMFGVTNPAQMLIILLSLVLGVLLVLIMLIAFRGRPSGSNVSHQKGEAADSSRAKTPAPEPIISKSTQPEEDDALAAQSANIIENSELVSEQVEDFQIFKRPIQKSIKAANGEMKNIDELMNIPLGSLFTKNLIALSNSPPPPGYYIHEVGGAPMGINEENSVVDKFNRLWRCKNVLVLDGACWPTSSWQSPTLTMMALSRRACLNIKKT